MTHALAAVEKSIKTATEKNKSSKKQPQKGAVFLFFCVFYCKFCPQMQGAQM
jgi:hypothetical protein